MLRPYRHTKIVFTAGPATASELVLEGLIRAGVDVCRINMAHASHDWTRATVATVRRVCDRVGRQVSIMMDIKGPEIRTGDVGEPLQLESGETFDLLVRPEARDPAVRATTVNYPGIVHDVVPGASVLIDSGLLRMEAVEVTPDRVRCVVRIPGPLGNRRHLNLPGVRVNLPSLTRKDREDIAVGIECGIDIYALSFVREPEDLDILRRFLTERGVPANIIAKIEDQSGLANLDDILRASDGLMVARGDLGIEIPYETLPIAQRRAVRACHRAGKPVIIATHMLESMISSPMPSRAEITDIAHAVLEQADCLMLSAETSVGKYPLECVDVMNRIAFAIEAQDGPAWNGDLELKSPKELMLRSAVILGHEVPDCGILVFTRSGHLTRILGALRPRRSPIFGFTDVDRVFRQMLHLWGVEPFLMEFSPDPEETIRRAIHELVSRGWASPGANLVVITNVLPGDRIIDTIQLRKVE